MKQAMMFDSDVFSRLKKLPALSVGLKKNSGGIRGSGAGSFDGRRTMKAENVDEFKSVHDWLEFQNLHRTVGRADGWNEVMEKTIEKIHEREIRINRRNQQNESKTRKRYYL